MRSYFFPVIISLALHALVLFVLFVHWGGAELPSKKATPHYVQAKLVKLEAKTSKPKKASSRKVVDLTAQKRARERREAEARKARQQKAVREKAAREKAAKEKAAREKAAREKAARERAAEEKRRREQALDQALAEEDEILAEQSMAEAAQSYVAAIAQRIEMNWSRPPSARNGMSCELSIQLVPTGRVLDVKVVRSSGNAAFDRSAEQAVKKAEKFPELAGMDSLLFERQFRKLKLIFKPEDLRQ